MKHWYKTTPNNSQIRNLFYFKFSCLLVIQIFFCISIQNIQVVGILLDSKKCGFIRLIICYRNTAFCRYHILEINYNKWIFAVSFNLTDYFWTSSQKNSLQYTALCKIHLNFVARIAFKSLEIYKSFCLLENIQIYAFW